IQINGKSVKVKSLPLSYVVLNRLWHTGDNLSLRLPMQITLRTWRYNHDAVSVDYGPLTFSLKIGERWARYGGSETWPEMEVLPATPWNYGLVVDPRNPPRSLRLVQKSWPAPEQPFTLETAPLEIHAKARKIPAWQQDRFGMVGKLQP